MLGSLDTVWFKSGSNLAWFKSGLNLVRSPVTSGMRTSYGHGATHL